MRWRGRRMKRRRRRRENVAFHRFIFKAAKPQGSKAETMLEYKYATFGPG